jgi:hypothetical protein
MRRALAVSMTIVALAGLARVHGQEPPAATGPTTTGVTATTEPRAPIAHTTTVEGTLPDLEGRWLLLASLGLGQSAKRILPSVVDVRRVDGALEVRERHVVLPAAQNEALRRGNEELGGVWAPTASDLEAIDRAWETLEIEDRGIAQMEHQLTGRDAWDDDLKNDATTKDALWVLRQSYHFLPGGNRPTNQANLVAPTKVEAGVYSGNYLAVAVAAAPFPVPIKFEGTFRLIPVGRSAAPWWSRLGDFFKGCGRS